MFVEREVFDYDVDKASLIGPEPLDYLEVLKEEGFFREKDPLVLSMEVAPTSEEDEEIVLANTKRCLNRAWALLED